MMNEKCAVARDLMPLCIDGSASEASRSRVEKHVADCGECAQIYEEMKAPVSLDVPENIQSPQFDQAVRRMKGRRHRRIGLSVLLGVLLAVLVGGGVWLYFSCEMPVTAEMSFAVTEEGIGVLCVRNVPKGASLQLHAVASRFSGDEGKFDLYASLTATYSEIYGARTEYYYPICILEDNQPYVLQYANNYEPISRIIQGTHNQGGKLFYQLGDEMETISLSGLNIRTSVGVEFTEMMIGFVTPVPVTTLPPSN